MLEGGCRPDSTREPFSPILELLERSIEGQADWDRSRALEGCTWLARLLPELGIEPPELQLAPERERHLMFRAVGHYLANLGGSCGVLPVLDDLFAARLLVEDGGMVTASATISFGK